MSPLLFIAYQKTVIEDFKGDRHKNYKNRIMAYADGIAEYSVNREKIKEMRNYCFPRKGMTVNVEKAERLTMT